MPVPSGGQFVQFAENRRIHPAANTLCHVLAIGEPFPNALGKHVFWLIVEQPNAFVSWKVLTRLKPCRRVKRFGFRALNREAQRHGRHLPIQPVVSGQFDLLFLQMRGRQSRGVKFLTLARLVSVPLHRGGRGRRPTPFANA
jgi:hypothetical protein